MPCIIKPLIILSLLLLGLILIPQAQAEATTYDYYLRWFCIYTYDSSITFALGNQSETNGNGNVQIQMSTVYNGKSQFAFDVYRLYFDADFTPQLELIASKIGVMERSGNTEGYQSVTWTCPEWNFSKNGDSLCFELFARRQVSASVWGVWYNLVDNVVYYCYSFFNSMSIGAGKLLSSAWNITLYTYREWHPNVVTHRVYFGDSTYMSRIENVQHDNGIVEAGLSFSSGVVFVGVMAACVCVVVLAAGLSLKKRR
jgi:hypothetical protein